MVHGIGLPCPEFSRLPRRMVAGRQPACGVRDHGAPGTSRPPSCLKSATAWGPLIALIYVAWLGLHVWHIGTRDHLCRYGMLVLATLLAAAGLGIMGAVTRLPPVTAVAHSAAAALLLLSLVTLYHVARPATRSEKRST